MPNAVIVADVVRGFLEEGYPLFCGEAARRIIPNIQRLLEQEIARSSKVFYICDHHAPDDQEFKSTFATRRLSEPPIVRLVLCELEKHIAQARE